MGMIPGDEYSYIKERGKDEKGDYKIICTEVQGEYCNCHPETCGCVSSNYWYYTKKYEDGREVSVKKNKSGKFIEL